MSLLHSIRVETQSGLEGLSVADEKRRIDEVMVIIVDVFMEQAEKECPGFESFVNWLIRRRERLETMTEVKA